MQIERTRSINIPVNESEETTVARLAAEAGWPVPDYARLIVLTLMMPEGLRMVPGAPPAPREFMGLPLNNPQVQCAIESALAALKPCGPSREFSIVRTKLEEALLWLKAAERGDATSRD